MTGASGYIGNAADWVPIAGNALKPEPYQAAEQAAQEFLMGILRKETGATIQEYEQAFYGDAYLPQPGDGEEELKQKRDSRARAVEAFEAGMSGPAFEAYTAALKKGDQRRAAQLLAEARGTTGQAPPATPPATKPENETYPTQTEHPPLTAEMVLQMDAATLAKLDNLSKEEIRGLPDSTLQAILAMRQKYQGQ